MTYGANTTDVTTAITDSVFSYNSLVAASEWGNSLGGGLCIQSKGAAARVSFVIASSAVTGNTLNVTGGGDAQGGGLFMSYDNVVSHTKHSFISGWHFDKSAALSGGATSSGGMFLEVSAATATAIQEFSSCIVHGNQLVSRSWVASGGDCRWFLFLELTVTFTNVKYLVTWLKPRGE